MWLRIEQNEIYQPKDAQQLQVVRLEVQPRDRGAQIRPAFGGHNFLYVELNLQKLNHFSFALTVPRQWVH
jgi:hypothetical protein